MYHEDYSPWYMKNKGPNDGLKVYNREIKAGVCLYPALLLNRENTTDIK